VADDQVVPVWCDFFSVDEYDAFGAAVDDALGIFGAEGQDIDEGRVELAAGDPVATVYEFPLDLLAARCRASAGEQWPDICARHVMDWAEGEPQRSWLTNSPFDEVENLLDVWLTGKREVAFQGDPDGPDQPFSVRVADGLYASFLAEVPGLKDAPAMRSFVPNSAVCAWNLTAAEVLESGRRRLRRLPPPTWELRTAYIQDDQGGTEATAGVYFASAPSSVSTPVSAWALILDEVTPVVLEPAGLVAVPHRHTLIVGPPCDDDKTRNHHTRAVYHYADQAYEVVADIHRVSPLKYVYRPPGNFRSGREIGQARQPNS